MFPVLKEFEVHVTGFCQTNAFENPECWEDQKCVIAALESELNYSKRKNSIFCLNRSNL